MTQPESPGPRHSPGRRIFAAALVLVPVVLALAVPIYQRVDPILFGLPFFFWFQMAMAVCAAAACGAAYLMLFRDEEGEA